MTNSNYGPTLVKELVDAGVSGLPFTWGEGGVQFGPSVTDAQKAAIQAVFEAHDPTTTLPAPGPSLAETIAQLQAEIAELKAK
jgi:hypothetical protein